MTPEYLEELADIADPKKLWMLGWEEQRMLPRHFRQQLDTGVALRRHASDLRRLNGLLGTGKSLLTTPLSPNGIATKTVPTPDEHKRFLRTDPATNQEP